MKNYLFVIILLFTTLINSQENAASKELKKNNFKYIVIKSHFGSFIKSDNKLADSGILDNGYGGVTIKLGWQSTDADSWVGRYGYPSYGVGVYSGFLSDAEVFGNPNAVYGFIHFPFSNPTRRNVFGLEFSLGITYKLNPYDSETNPINEAIGARAAVYFNLDFGYTYKWTRELDFLYGFDFTHFSNGATYKPNNGLNLFGLNFGLRYNYNAIQSRKTEDLYSNDVLAARFKIPKSSPILKNSSNALSLYIAGGVAQNEDLIGTDILMGAFSGVIDYEHQFNEMHAITGGFDVFYDNRLRDRVASERWYGAVHAGYDFKFYKFAIKFQLGAYLGDTKNKGVFFMRPALTYKISKLVFAQVGLKTLDGGAADYIEYGIGFNLFTW